jgi:hypothetical protein
MRSRICRDISSWKLAAPSRLQLAACLLRYLLTFNPTCSFFSTIIQKKEQTGHTHTSSGKICYLLLLNKQEDGIWVGAANRIQFLELLSRVARSLRDLYQIGIQAFLIVRVCKCIHLQDRKHTIEFKYKYCILFTQPKG